MPAWWSGSRRCGMVAASVLIVWSNASGSGSRECGGRTRLQKVKGRHNLVNNVLVAHLR